MKDEKTNKFVLFCSRFYVTFNKLLHLGIKNKQVCFVLLSILRNFAHTLLYIWIISSKQR